MAGSTVVLQLSELLDISQEQVLRYFVVEAWREGLGEVPEIKLFKALPKKVNGQLKYRNIS